MVPFSKMAAPFPRQAGVVVAATETACYVLQTVHWQHSQSLHNVEDAAVVVDAGTTFILTSVMPTEVFEFMVSPCAG
jgi:hypothetical protein